MSRWRKVVDTLPFGSGVRVIAIDPNGLCALEKAVGVRSHPNSPDDRSRSLFRAVYDSVEESYMIDGEKGVRRVWLLNRLDSATSGLILVAFVEAVADAVRKVFREREVLKIYRALVFGHARMVRQCWRDRMGVKAGKESVRAVDAGGKHAETDMRRLQLIPGSPARSLLELVPRTGRTHQLRYQCAKHRLPIVGDQTYGDFRANREFARRTGSKRLFLHACEIRLEYRLSGRSFGFEAHSPLPDAFGGGSE